MSKNHSQFDSSGDYIGHAGEAPMQEHPDYFSAIPASVWDETRLPESTRFHPGTSSEALPGHLLRPSGSISATLNQGTIMKTQHIEKIQQRSQLVEAASKLVWLDRVTAAAYMGIGTSHLDILIKQRSIPASKLGNRVIIRRQAIDDYLHQCSPATHRFN